MNSSLLIIDDNAEFIELLTQYLRAERFNITTMPDGESGLKKAVTQHFDAIILDVMLPKLNGFEVLKKLREQIDTPVLMLTARIDDIDKIVGLEIGADDYLHKPCNPRELLARLRAILRRSSKKSPFKRLFIEHNGIEFDSLKRLVTIDKQAIELTNAEFNILEILIKSPGQAFSKEELTQYALCRKYTAFDRSIDVHISNLRNKLGNNKNQQLRIKTVRGFGYLLNA